MATQEVINIGALPNDGTGDPLRVAFGKINNNFSNLFLTSTNVTSTYSVGNTANQIIWETPISQFAQGTFQIRSGDPSSQDSQDITIAAQITTNLLNVKWSGYGTTFNGNAITTYNMDVFAGNVRLLVNPIPNVVLQHLVSSSVSYIDVGDESLAIELDGYVADSLMTTEDDLILTTE